MFFILFIQILVQAQKIAIIGCGIGGATLAELLPHTTVYESNYQCGGRINHVYINGMEAIELGATYYIKDNQYVQRQVEKRNLTVYKRDLGKLGVIKNQQFILERADSGLINNLKLLINYGFSPKKMKDITDSVLKNFKQIYQYLDDGKYYKNLDEFLEIIQLSNVNMNFTEFLSENEIDKQFQEEFIDAILLAVYNQKNVNTVAGLITMVAAFNDAYSIKGGNRQLINEDSINVVHTQVDYITRLNNGKYKIFNDIYDYVVFANRATLNLQFDNIKVMTAHQYVTNKETYVYVIAGKISQKFTGQNIDNYNTTLILDNDQVTELRQECNRCFGGWNIYKVQAKQELQIEKVFETYQILSKKHWKPAYPQLNELNIDKEFEYEDNFFYLNQIEGLASCMELAMIQAKNVANIIQERIKNQAKEDL